MFDLYRENICNWFGVSELTDEQEEVIRKYYDADKADYDSGVVDEEEWEEMLTEDGADDSIRNTWEHEDFAKFRQ